MQTNEKIRMNDFRREKLDDREVLFSFVRLAQTSKEGIIVE